MIVHPLALLSYSNTQTYASHTAHTKSVCVGNIEYSASLAQERGGRKEESSSVTLQPSRPWPPSIWFWNQVLQHMIGLLGPMISSSQGLYLHGTTQHRKTKENIHAPSRIQTCDPVYECSRPTWPLDRQSRRILRIGRRISLIRTTERKSMKRRGEEATVKEM
jgi:hypothetical protein